MRILIFTEGTVIMPRNFVGLNREERVAESKKNEPYTDDFKNYIPNGNPINKILKWKKKGAEILYLTSRTTAKEIDDIKNVLMKFNFPDWQNLYFRKEGEEYKDVAERLMPDVLIEDDCESIGGEAEMTHPHIREDIKRKIKSIVVKEFGGIDLL